jgi:hypothetical protein
VTYPSGKYAIVIRVSTRMLRPCLIVVRLSMTFVTVDIYPNFRTRSDIIHVKGGGRHGLTPSRNPVNCSIFSWIRNCTFDRMLKRFSNPSRTFVYSCESSSCSCPPS